MTLPLGKQRGIEAFQDNVMDAESQLCGGLLGTPRELEIMLIQSGRVRDLACGFAADCSYFSVEISVSSVIRDLPGRRDHYMR